MTIKTMMAAGGILFCLLLLAGLLVRRGGVALANRLLAAMLACMSFYLLSIIAISHQWTDNSIIQPVSMLFSSGLILCPALLLGFVLAITEPAFTLKKIHLWHMLPFLSLVLLLAGLLMVHGSSIGDAIQRRQAGSYLGILYYGLQIIYCAIALNKLQQHTRRLPAEFSYQEQVTLNWLRILLCLTLILPMIGLLLHIIRLLGFDPGFSRGYFSVGMILLLYYLVGFIAMYQPAIFVSTQDEEDLADQGNKEQTEPQADSVATKYETTALDDSVAEHYWNQLQLHMENERPFLDNKLRIGSLAKQLDMPVHHLSQTINRCAKQNFFDYINGFRVAAAIEMLEQGSNGVANIAFDAGFNSESAFYRHFKKITGKTPKQLRKDLASRTS